MVARRSYLYPKEIQLCINSIPKLSCYKKKNSRKPLPVEAFQLLIQECYYGALRINEGIFTRVKDLDPDNFLIKLPKTKTGWVWCKCAITTKYGKKKVLDSCDPNCKYCNGRGKREIPQFTNVGRKLTLKILKFANDRSLGPEDFVYNSPTFNKPITDRWVRYQLVELTDLLQLPITKRYKLRVTNKMYTHIFRRSFAKQMERDKFPLSDIMKKLRQTNIATTSAYLEGDLEDIQERELELYG